MDFSPEFSQQALKHMMGLIARAASGSGYIEETFSQDLFDLVMRVESLPQATPGDISERESTLMLGLLHLERWLNRYLERED